MGNEKFHRIIVVCGCISSISGNSSRKGYKNSVCIDVCVCRIGRGKGIEGEVSAGGSVCASITPTRTQP